MSTTANELRAAADRCRDLAQPGWVDVDNASPECVADLLTLARAYLTEHVEDGDCPFGLSFLRSLGFARGMQSAGDNNLTLRRGQKIVTHYANAEANEHKWSVQRYANDGPAWLPACLNPVTRDDVIRLLATMGMCS